MVRRLGASVALALSCAPVIADPAAQLPEIVVNIGGQSRQTDPVNTASEALKTGEQVEYCYVVRNIRSGSALNVVVVDDGASTRFEYADIDRARTVFSWGSTGGSAAKTRGSRRGEVNA